MRYTVFIFSLFDVCYGMTYLVGLIAIAIGIGMVLKTEWIVENFGSSSWAEEHMGTSGGSRLMYKLIGIAFIVLALMGMTGLLGSAIIGIFGRLFGL